jgi:hypothetical protein
VPHWLNRYTHRLNRAAINSNVSIIGLRRKGEYDSQNQADPDGT